MSSLIQLVYARIWRQYLEQTTSVLLLSTTCIQAAKCTKVPVMLTTEKHGPAEMDAVSYQQVML